MDITKENQINVLPCPICNKNVQIEKRKNHPDPQSLSMIIAYRLMRATEELNQSLLAVTNQGSGPYIFTDTYVSNK